jgi:hypothetical protein
MKRGLTMAIVVVLTGSTLDGHEIDEYVQATRVAVSRDRIVVSLDLTPGVAIAPALIEHVDRDRDQHVSPLEAEAYGREVLSALTATLDAAPLALRLTRVEVPPAGDLRDGVGAIRLEATAAAAAAAGRHHLIIHNAHRPHESVYLANALIPADDDIRIARQDRDARQQLYRLEYDVTTPRSSAALGWMLAAAAVLALQTRWRRRAAAATLS